MVLGRNWQVLGQRDACVSMLASDFPQLWGERPRDLVFRHISHLTLGPKNVLGTGYPGLEFTAK